MKSWQRSGWRPHANRPPVTVHSPSRRFRLRVPKGLWSVPRVSVNADGTVTVKMSLVNHGGSDVSVSIRLRHSDGWWMLWENPQLTLKAEHGPVDIAATFRPPPGHRVRTSDQLSVEVQANGLPVADATAAVARSPIPLTQAAVLGCAAALSVTGTVVAVDRASHQATASIAPTSTSVPVQPSTTTTTAPPATTPTTVRRPLLTPTTSVTSTTSTTAPPLDVCPNVAGNQPSVPAGFALDAVGRCVPEAQPCSTSTRSGGEGRTVTRHELGQRGPLSFQFDYQTYNIADEIIIQYDGTQAFQVGPVATDGWVTTTVTLPAGTSTQIEVTVVGPQGTTTGWDYTVSCPAARPR